MRWDLFCRVVDNHGDLGVCWRLSADLGARGEHVRLWLDDARALAWMAPQGAAGVQVLPWDAPVPDEVGDVVVEAFGCDPPPAFVDAMCNRPRPPVWVNLEYLSAEDYVARSHCLPSPVASARGLPKWFFFPGFEAGTGGLIREPGLLDQRACFERGPWLAAHGVVPRDGEQLVSLFGYRPAPLGPWLTAWSARRTLLLVAPGPLCEALRAWALPDSVRVIELPWFTQVDYDRLLWSCDVNHVRGEDSFVRAQWAGVPFLWHIYPQDDGVHERKLAAFLDRFLADADAAFAAAVRRTMWQWNGLAEGGVHWPAQQAWAAHCRHWCDSLAARPDLVTALTRFCIGKQPVRC